MKRYIKSISLMIVIEVIFNAFATIALAGIPFLTMLLFDAAQGKNDTHILIIILMYALCISAHLLFTYFEVIVNWRLSNKFEMNIKRDLFNSILSMKRSKFIEREVAEYVSLQSNDVSQIEMNYLTPMIDLLKSANVMVVYSVILILFVDFRVTVIIFLMSLVSVILGPNITAKRLGDLRERYLTVIGNYYSKVTDLLDGFQLINNRTKPQIVIEHNQILDKTLVCRYAFGRLKALSDIVNGMFIFILHIMSFGMIGYLLISKQISIGEAVASFGYLECFISPLQSIAYDLNAIRSTTNIKESVLNIIDGESIIENQGITNFSKEINFVNVSVNYNNFSLEEFSFKFKKGKKYAIIGHNGSGKSTLINILTKQLEPHEGNVSIDGTALADIDISKFIAYTHQNMHMYSDDYHNNITVYGSYDTIENSIVLESIGESMQCSINTNKDCQLLSAGEKQAVALCRAELSGANVWILDEPFSAMDMKVTSNLTNRLLEVADATVLLVTHDLSEQLRDFDEILILENGKLIKNGTYDDLYKDNIYLQLSGSTVAI